MSKPVKFTEFLVNPKPYEYSLQPYIARQNKQFHFEQDIVRSQTLIPTKPRPKITRKIQHDYTQYIPLEYVSWEDDLELFLNHGEKKKEIRDDLPLKLLFDNLLCEIWETQIDKPAGPIQLYYQDPNLIFTAVERKKKKIRRYNLSNDRHYIPKKRKTEGLSQLGVQHSVVALRLHRDLFKTYFTNEELGKFHRNYFKLQQEIKFVRKCKITHTFIKKPDELTIEDGCDFCLVEYCEENPIFLNNSGMVSVIECFKREDKKDDLKISRAVEPFFNVTTLTSADPSPFPIGDVKPGKSTIVMSNNMFKVPLYKQPTDVFIVSMNGNQSSIREVSNFLVAGQILPLIEVYAPHSKTLNHYCKNRLRLASNTFPNRTMKMKDLDDMFPSFSEGSKRKWLKEFAEKRNMMGSRTEDIPITPENACQYESMLVGEKLIRDGHIDINLAPWNLTKNFVKGMIEVVGKGDPTGEGFSFLRGTKENFNQLVDERWSIQEHGLTKKITFDDLTENEAKELEENLFDISGKLDKTKVLKEEKVEPKINQVNKANKSWEGIKIIRIVNGFEEIEIITDKDLIRDYLNERKKIRKDDKRVQLKCGGCGQVGHMKTNKTCPNYVDESKQSKKKKDVSRRKPKNVLCESILLLVGKMFSLPYSSAFHRPVNVKKFPNYLNFIQQPIDLSTIKNKARLHKYVKYEEFLEDIKLLSANCVKYNGPDHSYSKVSQDMVAMAEEWIEERDELKNELRHESNNIENNDFEP